jgi:hypothetical protein
MVEKLAKDVDSCETCPLYNKDCIGEWTSDGGGNPVEPPCTSWVPNTRVYAGMYD